jgi:NitT/TauT family transport system substrate-binding protein
MKWSGRIAAAAAAVVMALCAGAVFADAAAELRVGVLPDVDSLPLLVADAEGRFAAEGVRVRLVRFTTAMERDAALQAGAVDGVVSDLLAAALAAQAGFDVRVASLTDGRYGIVTAPGSGITTAAGLANVPIGISTNTIIQYATDTLLSRAGLAREAIAGTAVPKIQVRMELLLSGQLKAACLPEPLLTVARARGAALISASDDAGFKAGVILFTRACLDSRLADARGFYKAYWKAAQAVNASPDSYRDFLVRQASFPEEARSAFVFVSYKAPRLPDPADVAAVISWMRGRGLLTGDVDGARLLDGRAVTGW